MTSMGDTLPLWTVLPFVGLLLSIAIFPLALPGWWHHNRNQAIVAALFGIPMALYIGARDAAILGHTAAEYFSFIVLLAALYIVAGGIYVTGNLLGTPKTNLAFLSIGAVAANLVGTTGASMILIRPLLRANSERKHTVHIFIFFIFIVSNCGGLLTPLGDPPLFLGFLRGIPFFWTLALFPQWLAVIGLLLVIFAIWDTIQYGKEKDVSRMDDAADYVPLGIAGKVNFVFLFGVLGAAFLPGLIREGADHSTIGIPWRELAMIAMLAASLKLGPRNTRAANSFSFAPIAEVAILFAGIFATMIPALEILRARGDELNLTEPWQFFWITGSLSAFLDNAPAYLTFATAALGNFHLHSLHELTLTAQTAKILSAISCGAVFMGAMSYIGNAPNFMVKSVCEESGLKMPSFFGYMLYSVGILGPTFLFVSWVFF